MLNLAQIIGRLGQSPELKYTQSGTAVTTLSIATDEGYTDKDGNKVDRTQWHRCILFNKQAENACQYLEKGSLVYVSGKLATRKWQDKDGNDRYTTEIMANTCKYLSRKGENGNSNAATDQYDDYQPAPYEMDDSPF